MERVHYRRVSPSRLNGGAGNAEAERRRYRNPEDDSGDNREQWIVQAIVSGLILIVVLLARLVDNDFTVLIKNGLRQALTGQTSAESLWAEARRFSEKWQAFNESGEALDDLPSYTDTATSPSGAEEPTAMEVFQPTQSISQEESAGNAEDNALYIDMDVLAELNARTASDDAVKSRAPEPTASPEPQD